MFQENIESKLLIRLSHLLSKHGIEHFCEGTNDFFKDAIAEINSGICDKILKEPEEEAKKHYYDFTEKKGGKLSGNRLPYEDDEVKGKLSKGSFPFITERVFKYQYTGDNWEDKTPDDSSVEILSYFLGIGNINFTPNVVFVGWITLPDATRSEVELNFSNESKDAGLKLLNNDETEIYVGKLIQDKPVYAFHLLSNDNRLPAIVILNDIEKKFVNGSITISSREGKEVLTGTIYLRNKDKYNPPEDLPGVNYQMAANTPLTKNTLSGFSLQDVPAVFRIKPKAVEDEKFILYRQLPAHTDVFLLETKPDNTCKLISTVDNMIFYGFFKINPTQNLRTYRFYQQYNHTNVYMTLMLQNRKNMPTAKGLKGLFSSSENGLLMCGKAYLVKSNSEPLFAGQVTYASDEFAQISIDFAELNTFFIDSNDFIMPGIDNLQAIADRQAPKLREMHLIKGVYNAWSVDAREHFFRKSIVKIDEYGNVLLKPSDRPGRARFIDNFLEIKIESHHGLGSIIYTFFEGFSRKTLDELLATYIGVFRKTSLIAIPEILVPVDIDYKKTESRNYYPEISEDMDKLTDYERQIYDALLEATKTVREAYIKLGAKYGVEK